MKIMKAVVVLSLLGLASMTGCGGIEAEEPAGEGALQTAEQALCSGLPSTAGCDTEIQPIPEGDYCVFSSGFVYTHYCGDKNTAGCRVFRCSSGTWDSGVAGRPCDETLALTCT